MIRRRADLGLKHVPASTAKKQKSRCARVGEGEHVVRACLDANFAFFSSFF